MRQNNFWSSFNTEGCTGIQPCTAGTLLFNSESAIQTYFSPARCLRQSQRSIFNSKTSSTQSYLAVQMSPSPCMHDEKYCTILDCELDWVQSVQNWRGSRQSQGACVMFLYSSLHVYQSTSICQHLYVNIYNIYMSTSICWLVFLDNNLGEIFAAENYRFLLQWV